jgi:cytochrome c peroxidase
MAYLSSPPLGLPPTPVPEDTPVTAEQVALGRKLFFDRRLSLNGTFSCAICHIPDQGFTSNELQTAVGIEGRSVRRNTPTLYNVGYANLLFHDGRETRHEVTQDPHDRWKYKTPSLRNLALTAPCMHNGSLLTLAEAVELYDRGGCRIPCSIR